MITACLAIHSDPCINSLRNRYPEVIRGHHRAGVEVRFVGVGNTYAVSEHEMSTPICALDIPVTSNTVSVLDTEGLFIAIPQHDVLPPEQH